MASSDLQVSSTCRHTPSLYPAPTDNKRELVCNLLSIFRLLEQPSGFAWLPVPMLARHSATQPLASRDSLRTYINCCRLPLAGNNERICSKFFGKHCGRDRICNCGDVLGAACGFESRPRVAQLDCTRNSKRKAYGGLRFYGFLLTVRAGGLQ